MFQKWSASSTPLFSNCLFFQTPPSCIIQTMNDAHEEVKVICCDIDGTLVRDDKSLSEENMEWIRKAVAERNVAFTLVSGRMYNGVRPFYDMLGISGPISCYNGGTLYDDEGNIVEDHRIPHETALKLVEIQRRSKVGMILFNDRKWYLEKLDNYIYPHKRKIYLSECETGSFDRFLGQFDSNKILFMSPSDSDLDRVQAMVKEAGLFEDALTPYRAEHCLELIPASVNKGLAIEALSRHFGVPCANIMALGDDTNDIEMLKTAGISVAMGNAVPAAKQAARFETCTNNENGVAKAIQRFVFGM